MRVFGWLLFSKQDKQEGSIPALWLMATSLKEERLSFLAMNFFRCSTVAWAEHRIHFRFRPRSLLLLHSRQMLTWKRKDARSDFLDEHSALESL